MGVPTIFPSEQSISPESSICDPVIDTMIVHNNPIQHQSKPDCNCNSLQNIIQIKSMEIVAQNEKIKYQADMILSLQQKLQSQSDEMKQTIQVHTREKLTQNKKINLQVRQISKLEQEVQAQSDKIYGMIQDHKQEKLSLEEKIKHQADEILHFRAKFQCDLVKFAVEAKDPKVNNYF